MSILQALRRWTAPSLPVSAFKSDDEIVEDLLSKMSPESRETLRSTPFANLIGFHFTAGRALRNEYKLWDPLNPYVKDRHPDDISHAIIETLWRRLQRSPSES